jgi:hypothetical protein
MASSNEASFPFVCILLLNWNGKEHLEYALPSVLATDYPDYELVVIDNASTDGSVEFVRGHFPSVGLKCNRRNLQWAAANNAGIRYAIQRGAKYVALLNNDIKVDPRWLRAAVQVAEERPQVGCIGFRVFNEYRDEDRDGYQFEAAINAWQEIEVTETKHIAGCALFIRTHMFEGIGFFDEVYVAYGEEDDLEKRAVQAGYQMVRVNVPLWHHSMGSWGRMPWHASRLAIRNTLRCAIKNEDLRGVLRTLRLLCNLACNPSCGVDMTSFHYRRLRHRNYLVRCGLLTYAILWNIVYFPQSMFMRVKEENAIRATRIQLKGAMDQ